jgi:hypothetical protein
MVDAVLERVFEAETLHRACLTDAAGNVDAHAVTREKSGRRDVSTEPSVHPFSFHGPSDRDFCCFYGAAAGLVPSGVQRCLAEARRDVTPDVAISVPKDEISETSRYCFASMSIAEQQEINEPPRGHVRVVYMGPVAPHWDVHSDFGDRAIIEEFRARVLARLELLPPHDPQFRRNRERVVRDAERENLLLDWDLGIPEEEEAS